MKTAMWAAMAVMMSFGVVGSAAAASSESVVKYDGRAKGREYTIVWTAFGCFGTKGNVARVCEWKKVGRDTQQVSYRFKWGTTKRQVVTQCADRSAQRVIAQNGRAHTIKETVAVRVGNKVWGDDKSCSFSSL